MASRLSCGQRGLRQRALHGLVRLGRRLSRLYKQLSLRAKGKQLLTLAQKAKQAKDGKPIYRQ